MLDIPTSKSLTELLLPARCKTHGVVEVPKSVLIFVGNFMSPTIIILRTVYPASWRKSLDHGLGQRTFNSVMPVPRSVLVVFSKEFAPMTYVEQVVSCKLASETFPGANVINLWKDRLFAGDARNGTVTIFQIHEDKSLTKVQTVVRLWMHHPHIRKHCSSR